MKLTIMVLRGDKYVGDFIFLEKKSMKAIVCILMGLGLSVSVLYGQKSHKTSVFLMGENEKNYESIKESYRHSLLEVCEADMKKAFENWINLVTSLEDYAKQEGVDINGVKLWLHTFFSEEGKIDHIGFLLKPASKNVNIKELKVLLKEFGKNYTFPIQYDHKFYHYTGVTFPTFSQPSNRK